MSARIDAYLSTHPEKTLQVEREETEDEDQQPPSPTDTGSSGSADVPSVDKSGILGKGWKKSKQFGRAFFK